MSNETNATGILNTILADGTVAGNVVYWEAAGEPNIAYWLGKTHWGKGIASAALAQFLTKIEARPVYAHVAKHNFASIRVLQKCGFQLAREEMCDGDVFSKNCYGAALRSLHHGRTINHKGLTMRWSERRTAVRSHFR